MEQHEQDLALIRFIIRNNGEEIEYKSNSGIKDLREINALIETIICNYESGLEDEGITGFTINIVRNAHDLEISLQEAHTHFVGIYADQLGITYVEDSAMQISEPLLWKRMYGTKYEDREV